MIRSRYLGFFVFFMLLIAAVLPFTSSNDSFMEKLTTGLDIAATLSAAGGLLGLMFQFKRERDLSEADFTLRLNQNFVSNERIARIYNVLEVSSASSQQTDPFSDQDLIDLANYLSFFEPFWGLIQRGAVGVEMIDILAYRYFLATNNRFVQERLLCREDKEHAWRNIYRLHEVWSEYRKKNDLPVWGEDQFGLSQTSSYRRVVKRKS